jgi:superfamily II DNA or RNA helicase
MSGGLALDASPFQQQQQGVKGLDHPVITAASGSASIHSILRPYQVRVIEDYSQAVARGLRRLILTLPTGSGKTVVASAIAHNAVTAGQRVLVLAHRREIITQTSCKFSDVQHGIILAGEPSTLNEPAQIASVQTLHARSFRSRKLALPPADLIVVDECHHATARTWHQIIDAYPGAVIVGLTATPVRGDGRGLGGIFEALIEGPQVAELVAQGYLVPTKVYAPTIPDLAGVRVQAGDYVESQLADVMDRPKLVGDIITHWHKLAENRRTVVFATGVGHSVHIRDEFVKSGVLADHIDGGTPKDERDDILDKLRRGAINVVVNCMVLTEGWDMPEVGTVVLARPTKKMGLYRQMVGRVLRPAPGKVDAIIIDHSGAVHRHGFVEDRVEWTLAPDRYAENPTHAARGEHGLRSRLVDCSQCGALRVGGEACRHCGFKPSPPAKYLHIIDGDLGLVDRTGRTVEHAYSAQERADWHAQLTWIAQERGYKPGWTAHKYKEKFGAWPVWGSNPEPMPPTPEVRSWVRSRQIAYAKARGVA